ncbi:hypothetical protein QNH28_23085 [Paenibacillus sp. G2S3]|nr:hypothetical protein [Paenibacillus sp. G2S3]WHY18340.1 hypothetical protein QNH28_23085 [Paenibacillus sp. G2S3]
MTNHIDVNTTLSQYFPLPAHLYCKDTSCIVAMALEEERGQN